MFYMFVRLRQSHQVRPLIRVHFLTFTRYVRSVYCTPQEPVLAFSKLKQGLKYKLVSVKPYLNTVDI